FKNKIKKVMRNSKQVVAGNAYLAEMANNAGAGKIILIPTVIDSLKYSTAKSANNGSMVKIGWIGSPSTLKYLISLRPVLDKVNNQFPFELVTIGGGGKIGFTGKETLIEWSEEEEVREIQKLD